MRQNKQQKNANTKYFELYQVNQNGQQGYDKINQNLKGQYKYNKAYLFLVQLQITELMKIFGIGVDLVQNSRIRNVLTKSHAKRFLVRVLHQDELKHYDTINMDRVQIQYVASRWAVKEAVVKALGRRQLVFNQVKIVKDQHGKPFLQVCSQENKDLFQQLKVDKVHISLAHQDDFTTAYALAIAKQ